MATKADLMLESAKKNEKLTMLENSIRDLTAKINAIPGELQQSKDSARAKAQADYQKKRESKVARINSAVAKKRDDASKLIDTFTELEPTEFAGKVEIQELEDHLAEVYPDQMILNYVCMNPIDITSDEEAYRIYSSIEAGIMSTSKGGKFSGAIFNGLTNMLNVITDKPNVGSKILIAIPLLYAVFLIFAPFLLLTAFAVMGITSAIHGFAIKSLLRKLYSVKLYLNASYDEDIFRQDKDDVMCQVDAFLDAAKEYALNALNEDEFHYDESIDRQLEHKADIERKRLEQSRELNNSQLEQVKEELAKLVEQIDALNEEEAKRAQTAKKEFLGTVKWERKWIDYLFVDVTNENKVMMLPFVKANSCYFSKDAEALKAFSRLVTFQCMLRMHPEYASQVVLDYKYMGGELTQYLSLEANACIKMCFTEEDTKKQQELITNDIRARTKNILASSASLDDFNELMKTYNANGEYYVITHIFGLTSINTDMLNWFRNGPRVGYIFKFYWTVQEMQNLKDNLPLEDIKDFYEILNNPMPRTSSAVKRLVGLTS